MGVKNTDEPQVDSNTQARGYVEVKTISATSQNVVSIFGCLPNLGVSLQSTLAHNVVKILINNIIKNGGVLIMPDALKRLTMVEKEATYNAKCSHDIWIEAQKQPDFVFRPKNHLWLEGSTHEKSIDFMFPSPEEYDAYLE